MNFQFVTLETFVIQFVILLVVLYVLNRFIFTPYLAYLDEWEAKQKEVQENYDNADKILSEKKAQWDKIVSDARAKGNTIIEEAESLAESKKETILAQAEKEVQEQKEVAQAQIEQERQSMLASVKGNIVDTALKLNEKMFQNEKASKDFLEKNIDTL